MNSYMIVAEDDADDILLLQAALSDTNFPLQVLFVADGSEVINHLAVHGLLPALMILDVNMPKINGLQVLEFIKAHTGYNNIPVHILSTTRTKYAENKCLALGAASYTVKPDSYRELVDWLISLKNNL